MLIRGVDGTTGLGRVGKLFNVSKKDYGQSATFKNGLYLEDRGVMIKEKDILISARIGVDYAGPIWSKKKYNFNLKIEEPH